MSEKIKVNRRNFLKTTISAGAGLIVAFQLPVLSQQSNAVPVVANNDFAPNAFLNISPDNKITIWVTRAEMGQGVRTSLPMILAEELEVDWEKVKIKQAAMVPRFKGIRFRTSGSGSVFGSWMPLRNAGAAAREMLAIAASQKWNVGVETCRAEKGAILHVPTRRLLTYGELTEAAAKLPVPETPKQKAATDYKIIGQRVKRIDGAQIVQGSAEYGFDIRVPNMRYAVIAHSPVLGGKVVRWDDAKAKAVPGVLAIVHVTTGIKQGVAVVAENTWAALKGREVLNVIWDEGQNKDFSSEAFIKKLHSEAEKPGFTTRKEGEFSQAFSSAVTKLEAVYEYPFQAHAMLETMNCVVDVRKDSCEIWTGTQAAELAQSEVSKLLGIPVEAVKVNIPLLGGGFGRRLFVDNVPEAAEISKSIGAPVKVIWTRVDDMKHGFFHPATVCKMSAGINAEKNLVAWKHKTATSDLSMFGPPTLNAKEYTDSFVPWGGYDTPYSIPALETEYVHVDSPVPTGAWRAVGYPQNVFARECFIDEVAHATGKDSLQFRLELLASPEVVTLGRLNIDRKKIRNVLNLVAERGDWGKPFTQAKGRRWGRGISCNIYHGATIIAQIAEVSVGDAGDVKVHRIISAVDCGTVINPLGLEGQVESGIVWGLSPVLGSKITFKNGITEQSSFRDFQVPRMSDMPKVETHIVPGTTRPTGIGEQPVPLVAPAVLNAVFAATGKRIRRLPIDRNELRR